MSFVNFNSFSFMFNELKQPLTVKVPKYNRDNIDEYGQHSSINYEEHKVNEPLITKASPNVTYQDTRGGQYSTVNKVWESLAIKNAPRGTIVIDSNDTKYKVMSSTKVTATSLWYYNLKVTGDRE